MKFLAIDTSSKILSVAARNGEKCVRRDVDCAMQHSVRLMDEVDEVLKEVGLPLKECDFIACVVGPGSFTGIRIGISTVKGLCFATERLALAVTSLEAIAYADIEPNKIALVDAGHGNVYAEGFGTVLLARGFYPLAEVMRVAKETGAKLVSAESVAGVETTLVSPSLGLVNVALARFQDAAPASELAAVYLRKSSAEEGR